ncbi:MAG: carboxypeptidase regulatory-like domain-containing protein [Chitinophagaceae bacterium]|nr:carboxypeptidase regulatory-like domain-containing protein [Chitinophagaceae bacterium]
MPKLRKLLLPLFAMFVSMAAVAQVTTSSITGTVKDKSGNALEGATVTATHTPTGTVYTTISKKGGVFNIVNARIGGPYKLKVEFVGQKAYEVEGFTLSLGEPYDLKVEMGDDVKQITEVVVTGGKRRGAVEKTGAATNINNRLITTVPTINRSITDFTRLTPQANGNSFAGRDARMNNIQIDGANLNNNFGLDNNPLPGGANQPVSLDIIEEISVNVAPYDVTQGNFTGAGINVVTKSGTNRFKGSAYTLYRNENFNGEKVASTKLPNATQRTNNLYGATFGGPIIKNKLFFFASGETEVQSAPGILWTPTGGSGLNNISRVTTTDLQTVSDFLRTRYGYETGAYDNFKNFETKNYKIFGRIDWNINKIHRLTVRYNEMTGDQDIITNATSIPNNPRFIVPGGTASRTNLPQSRFGAQAMSYQNSTYAFRNVLKTGAFELNSSKGGKWANQLLATYTLNQTTRNTPSTKFPFVDIFDGSGNNYISFGREPFSNNNDVLNRIFNITNNFKYFAGKHTITVGGTYEQQYVGNMFMPGSQSYYAFRNISDFINNAPPAVFSYTFSLQPDKTDANGGIYSANLRVGQLGLYAQDDITLNDRFKLTLGLRVDKAIYLERPIENPAIKALSLPDKDGKLTNYSTGQWPSQKFLFSPRIGFRWDVNGDKTMIVRGGAGIFTGRFPFVFLTNMPSTSQTLQANVSVTNSTPGANMANFLFNPNPDAYRGSFSSIVGGPLPSGSAPVLIDPDFVFPQVARINLAVDKRLGKGWTVTFEGIFNKDINAIRMRNANQIDPDARFSGVDNRQRYSVPFPAPLPAGATAAQLTAFNTQLNAALARNNIYPSLNNAIILENTNRGGGFQLTAQVTKTFSKGFAAMFAYTYTAMVDVTSNPGSTAGSVWASNATIGTQNDLELGMASAAIPHRFVGNISYTVKYAKHMATSISLFYEGSPQNNFSYIYQNDMNGDGNAADLLYIPRNQSEIIFMPITGNTPYSPQAQWDAFNKFIENSPLKKRRGQYVSRNDGLYPWLHQLNLQVQQDFYVRSKGGTQHTLRLQADILNFANMLNSNWGVRYFNYLGNTGNVTPLIFDSVDPASGAPRFRMQTAGGLLPTRPFQLNRSISSVWGMQLGLRYFF